MKTMDTRNVLIVEIERLDKRIADLLRSCKDKDTIIDELRAIIHVMSGGHGEKIIADNEMLKDGIAAAAKDGVKAMNLVRERGDEIEELESKLDQSARLIKDISANCKEHNAYLKSRLEAEEDKNRQLRYKIDKKQDAFSKSMSLTTSLQTRNRELEDEIDERNKEISKLKGGAWMLHNEDDRIDALQYGSITGLFNRVKELEGKLIDEERRSTEAHELLQDMTSHDWEQSNEITSMKISHGKERKTDRQTIKELEAKLANSERRFNELDDVLVRTFALLHVVNGCLRKRDKTIDELESELHR